MLEKFQRSFPCDGELRQESASAMVADQDLRSFFAQFGGNSFKDGLYRTISTQDVTRWNDRVHLAFPNLDGRVTCFGYDWLGRVFALDNMREENGGRAVLLIEPGTGEALEVPANLKTFHEEELVENGEAPLAISFYEEWRSSGGDAPKYDQCIGYKKPLFLGGADEVENLEFSDIEAYWHLFGQIIAQTKGLAPGTKVNITGP